MACSHGSVYLYLYMGAGWGGGVGVHVMALMWAKDPLAEGPERHESTRLGGLWDHAHEQHLPPHHLWAGSFGFPPPARCSFRGRPARLAMLEAKRPIPWYQDGQATHLWDPKAAVGELGDDASLPSSACIAFRDWRAWAKLVLILAKEISSTFVPRDFAILYPISRSGTKPQSPSHPVESRRTRHPIMRGVY